MRCPQTTRDASANNDDSLKDGIPVRLAYSSKTLNAANVYTLSPTEYYLISTDPNFQLE